MNDAYPFRLYEQGDAVKVCFGVRDVMKGWRIPSALRSISAKDEIRQDAKK